MKLFAITVFLSFIVGHVSEDGSCDKEKGCNSNQDQPKIFEDDPVTRLKHFKDINNLPPLNDPLYLIPDGQHPQVIWWYPDIYMHRDHNKIQCPLGTCSVTNDQNELKNPLTRGFIFYGTSFRADELPLPRLPHHEWALFHEESPKNNWIFSSDVGISLFNHTATFRRESDYPISTQFMRDPDEWLEDKYFVNLIEKNRLQKEEGLAPAVFVQRDCNPPSDRDTYIEELMKHLKIDSYGRCLNNKKMPEEIDGFHKLSTDEYYHFLAKYKFQIAFENCVCQDYMTEKVFRPLTIGSIPIYFGSSKIRDFMPTEKAVIVATDFASPKELAEYIMELNRDDNKYNEYLKHRIERKFSNKEFEKSLLRQPWGLPSRHHKPNFGSYMFSGFSCYVCDRLLERNNRLREHLKDPTVPPLPIKFANSSHMGCPSPKPILPNSTRKYSDIVYKFGEKEAKPLLRMLLANETDTTKWKDYLQMKTDKYP